MARRLKNRYRLKVAGLTINISLLKSFCDMATDKEIAEEILIIHRFWNTLENIRNGGEFDLKMTRASKGYKNQEVLK